MESILFGRTWRDTVRNSEFSISNQCAMRARMIRNMNLALSDFGVRARAFLVWRCRFFFFANHF